MKLNITPKSPQNLYPTDILFQTSFWGRVKNRLGWTVSAFDLSLPSPLGDVLVLTKRLDHEIVAVYVPQGPEYVPAAEEYGVFLETMSDAISKHLEPSSAFIRYDLPWFDPYTLDDGAGDRVAGRDTRDLSRPDDRLREIRMNFSTQSWNLRKAPFDLTVADSLVIDISGTEDEILSRMKPKTRYNIRLSERKGVRVVNADFSALPLFFDVYLQTAQRNGFLPCDYRHFSAIFETTAIADSPEVRFFLAVHGRDTLAGAIVVFSKSRATYLFGASTNCCRNLMGPYAIQWQAIRDARAMHCTTYDMGAISSSNDPTHPFHGMYRFKTGFGGRIEHRAGSWDYPLQQEKYELVRNHEMLRGIWMG